MISASTDRAVFKVLHLQQIVSFESLKKESIIAFSLVDRECWQLGKIKSTQKKEELIIVIPFTAGSDEVRDLFKLGSDTYTINLRYVLKIITTLKSMKGSKVTFKIEKTELDEVDSLFEFFNEACEGNSSDLSSE